MYWGAPGMQPRGPEARQGSPFPLYKNCVWECLPLCSVAVVCIQV